MSLETRYYHIDTPNSAEEGLHWASGTHAVNAKELQSALQEDIVVEHCQHRLVNLLCPLLCVTWNVCDVEISDGENKQQVVSLIKYVQSKRGSMMWEKDTTVVRTELPSASLLSALVQSMVDDTFFQGDLRETWGAKALNGLWNAHRDTWPAAHTRYTVHCGRVLCYGDLVDITGDGGEYGAREGDMLFWGCAAMMHTNFVHVDSQVLELVCRVIDSLSFRDRTTENVLLSSMPRDELDSTVGDNSHFQRPESWSASEPLPSNAKVPVFEGVQRLVLKGLVSTVSHGVSIEVLSRITVPSCDSKFLDAVVGPASPLHQQSQKACYVSTNMAVWRRAKAIDELATVFVAYSHCVASVYSNGCCAKSHLRMQLYLGRENFVLGGLSVLEALLQSCSLPGSQSHELGQFENGLAAAEEKILAPQTSFKARSGPLQFAMLGTEAGSTPVAQPNASKSGLSAKLALQNSRLMLGRVLDSSALGKRRVQKIVSFCN
ncbi:hypothetical protein FXO38_08679 [Capsicum annuum]|uniref:Uncharacterized protein n=1 Tax=Capsicum annuum TaxID=4072 RepID=A0A2G3ABN1_CAPAN|nr:hypothetical protein FXO37_18413 [Capsicum annuum]KAF3667283.1 hypothetical protein FXO38_08679 [Capsicum annuum]PHT91647.1 hypothetical protein T459_06760 [Capsicum annuum]